MGVQVSGGDGGSASLAQIAFVTHALGGESDRYAVGINGGLDKSKYAPAIYCAHSNLDAFRDLIVPNLVAGIIVLPLLTAIFDVVGIFGGYLVGVKLLGLSSGTYFGEMVHRMDMQDIMEGIYKSLSFGMITTLSMDCL